MTQDLQLPEHLPTSAEPRCPPLSKHHSRPEVQGPMHSFHLPEDTSGQIRLKRRRTQKGEPAQVPTEAVLQIDQQTQPALLSAAKPALLPEFQRTVKPALHPPASTFTVLMPSITETQN